MKLLLFSVQILISNFMMPLLCVSVSIDRITRVCSNCMHIHQSNVKFKCSCVFVLWFARCDLSILVGWNYFFWHVDVYESIYSYFWHYFEFSKEIVIRIDSNSPGSEIVSQHEYGKSEKLVCHVHILCVPPPRIGHQRAATVRQQDHRVQLCQQQMGVHEAESGQELPQLIQHSDGWELRFSSLFHENQ